MDWQAMLADFRLWLSAQPPLEIGAYMLSGFMYLLVGLFLAIHWSKQLHKFIDNGYSGSSDMEAGEGLTLAAMLLICFLLAACFWPLLLVMRILYRVSKSVANHLKSV